jgi:RNA polymerase sigma-70 factor, ECF subfamily
MSYLDVTKLKAGDEDALRSFYDFIVPKIRHIVATTLQNRIEVEDIVEEIIRRILSNFDVILRSEEPSKIEAYCLKIARNIALESRRHFEKEDHSVEITESYLNQKTAQLARNPEENFDTFTFVKEALEELTALEREIIIERYINEIPLQEIAEKVGISPNAIRSLLNRSLSKIRRRMARSESQIDHIDIKNTG